MSKIDTNAPIIQKTREMIKLLNVYLNHFPNHEKYGLCQHMRVCAYEVYGLIVESLKRYHKKTSLTQLDIANEKLKMFANLAFELGYFHYANHKTKHSDSEALRRYTALSCQLNEIGAMIGGWISRARAADGVMA